MADKSRGQFFTSEQLSDHRSLTPEGFLLIEAAPIARTGNQIYAAQELPAVQPGKDGLIIVERDPDEVFRPETIASFNGKPFTDDHPRVGMLTPDSWRDYARGTVLNPRRGDGLRFDNDFLYVDILVTDKDMIQAIYDGKKELSAGYDAEYETLAPGRARCMDIVGNHVALVDKGRCGPHCALGDSKGVVDMAVKSSVRSRFMDKFRSAIDRRNTRDALAAVSELNEDPEALGEIISDEMMGQAEPEGKHHVEVHAHFNGMGAPAPAKDADEPETPAPASGGGGGGDVGAQLQALSQRIENIERLLMSLTEEDQGGSESDNDENSDVAHDRRMSDTIIEPEKTWPKAGDEETIGQGYHMEKGAPDLPREKPGTGDRRGTGDRQRTGDRRAAVGDSTSMREAFVATLSKAETLCPGIRLPTFDAAAPARDTFDTLCGFRRKTLDAAYKTEDGRTAIDSIIDGRKAVFFDREWSCDAITVAFNGASSLMSQKNAHRVVAPRVGGSGGSNGFGKAPPSPADMNARAREAFKNQLV